MKEGSELTELELATSATQLHKLCIQGSYSGMEFLAITIISSQLVPVAPDVFDK